MVKIRGKNGTAKVFTQNIEERAVEQAKVLMSSDISKRTKVRFMPDVHWSNGVNVGTTIQLPKGPNSWKVAPKVVGADIGCGMTAINIGPNIDFTLTQLDRAVHEMVPVGAEVHKVPVTLTDKTIGFSEWLNKLTFKLSHEQRWKSQCSFATLGGGR